MHFSQFFLFASLSATALAQLDLELIASKLPACSISCSEQILPVAGCAFQDIPTCLCPNTTLQYQLASCIQTSCNQTEQFTAISVSQNLMCKGVPQPSRSAEISRIIIIISLLTFPTILLRLLSRWHTSQLCWDDWAMLASAVVMIPMAVIPIYNAGRGFGKHVWDVPPENIPSMQELYYVSQILYAVVLNLVKISILLLFLRVFTNNRFRLVTKICLLWMVCQTVAFFFAVTFQCMPVSSIWNPTPNRKCINTTAVIYAGAVCSIFEDVFIIILPIRELLALNMSPRQRLGVIFMFAIGSFACITSIVRLKFIVDYSFQLLDATWTSTDVVIWSVLEVFTATIFSSLMAIRPLLVKYMPALFQSAASTASSPTQNKFPAASKRCSKPITIPWSRSNLSEIELTNQEDKKVNTDVESLTASEGG
ncbi:hypothetical protein OIDMADRAFT_181260 [Oidiodendron maius Zn]|uniref:CFEM domain-containing protein n=1 Tax=Oidiodendron maius (strain Zn) TaxID=913774 RepID=A0A0C3H9S3_OIDMZ|nr:hypothetical protein OIDMADRAFT_181260 [Oidiodendron maius Zn]